MDYTAPVLAYYPPGTHIRECTDTNNPLFTQRQNRENEWDFSPQVDSSEMTNDKGARVFGFVSFVLPVGIWTVGSVCPESCWILTFLHSGRRWLQVLLEDYLHPRGYWWVTIWKCKLLTWPAGRWFATYRGACFIAKGNYFPTHSYCDIWLFF